ncbi:hypothetical protein [Paraburkholderia susongensis]|uniref:Uncharacterized protein n=1 Tax=Paraburkholderia susongensis TaxID=1515439 RepID=A0A1X7LZH3_9BURK|nr:hypothetical protein [Paraburkholderia susongensis]SMG58662.1 hypothetical protein SAMN06265784_111160 [Paraburkholderia susongensis]
MSLSVFEMCSVELRCQRPLGARYVICDEQHYKACLRKAADLERAKADTREFLGIAGLNRGEWEKDGNLVRSIQKRGWLWLHGARDRNPDTDGWWVIGALLAEVRRGSLLAIKGPRADLFPPPHSTPLRTLPASAVYFPDSEPRLSGRYDPGTRQSRLVAARAATSGGSGGGLPDTAVTGESGANADSADGSGLADDGDTSTLLGDVHPFEYREDLPDGDAMELAGGEGTPRNNQTQNKQFKAVVRVLRLNQDQARQLHDEISKQGLGYHEMLERGRDLFGEGND